MNVYKNQNNQPKKLINEEIYINHKNSNNKTKLTLRKQTRINGDLKKSKKLTQKIK